jgi:uncharacterized damage-inducible protein DinB
VPDQKPPRLEEDERHTVLALLQYQRSSIVKKVHGLSDESARRPMVGTGTSLLWLVKHLTRAEGVWICRRFAGQDIELPSDAVGPGDTVDGVVAAYRLAWARTERAIGGADLGDTCRAVGDEAPVNLRWVLMHLLEETARHAGHADILREMIDGSTGR